MNECENESENKNQDKSEDKSENAESESENKPDGRMYRLLYRSKCIDIYISKIVERKRKIFRKNITFRRVDDENMPDSKGSTLKCSITLGFRRIFRVCI